MKRFVLTVAIIILIFEILMFPKDAMNYAATGLELWFENMIPALFPFMVISGLVVRLDIAPNIISLLHPVFKRIFQTNAYCEYAIIMGFLCGYPMGAVIIKDLLSENKISVSQADYLLSFCNNIGPVFFCSLVLPLFPKEYHGILLIGMYGIPLFYGIILRYTFYKKAFITTDTSIPLQTGANDNNFTWSFMEALNQAIRSSLFLGACMIFFNMLRFLPAQYISNNPILEVIFSWIMEVNGAILYTGTLYESGKQNLALLFLPLMTLGGLSCICQTTGILYTTPCNIPKHILHKCIQCFVWFALMCVRLFY